MKFLYCRHKYRFDIRNTIRDILFSFIFLNLKLELQVYLCISFASRKKSQTIAINFCF